MTTTNRNRDFSLGKIYRIEPVCEYEEGDIYIGSTTQDLLCKRMRDHRKQYNRWKNEKSGRTMSFILFDKFGVDNCKIVLIENVNASNYDELVSREAHYIRTLKCVNKVIPLRTDAEYRKDNELKIKEHYEANREKISEQRRDYREKNKEKISERKRDYREENKEKINEQKRDYYKNNKEKVIETNSKYRNANKEKTNERQRKYAEGNKEKKREYNIQYYERKKQEKLDKLNNTVVVNL